MLFTEKYRPKTFDAIVPPDGLKDKFQKWKEEKRLDTNLIFYGKAGTGKSSTARAILKELDISDFQIINGSDETSVDAARELIDWAGMPSYDEKQKIVLIEEFERMSPNAQDSLKYAMEAYSYITLFILTTNNLNKITEPIQSRCEKYCFDNINKDEYVVKLFQICVNEGLFENGQIQDQTELKIFQQIINDSYPDFRTGLNYINQHIKVIDGKKKLVGTSNLFDGVLTANTEELVGIANKLDIPALQTAINNIRQEEIGDIYKELYKNLHWFTSDETKWRKILLSIQKYNVQHQTLVADADMNLAACLVECALFAQGQL